MNAVASTLSSPEVSHAAPAAASPPTQTGDDAFIPAWQLSAPKLPRKASDLTGKLSGKLQAVAAIGQNKYKTVLWLCRCTCGNAAFVWAGNFGSTSSCGCAAVERRDSTRQRLTGRRFGKLMVVGYAGQVATGAQRQTVWTCACDCGNHVVVRGNNLLSRKTRSCGCLQPADAASRRGNRHPGWNRELKQEDRDRSRLGTPTQRRWSLVARQIRSRDRVTCIACGAQGTSIHHLEPWAFDRELRYDAANLVTLCKECHEQFHELYGKDAGLEDFEEYLKP